jgi:uncharacterized membrane-anchored protein
VLEYERRLKRCIPIIEIKEDEKMAASDERTQRGKKLLVYGMFSLVAVTFVSVLLTVWMFSRYIPGGLATAFQTALIVSVIGAVACVIVWFVYTKAVLKE